MRMVPNVVDDLVEKEAGQDPYDDVKREQRSEVDSATGELNDDL